MFQLPNEDEVGMGYGSLAPGAATQPQSPMGSFSAVEGLLGTHAALLRQRLMAAHMNGGIAPQPYQTDIIGPNQPFTGHRLDQASLQAALQSHMHQLPRRTANPNVSNIAQLLQRFMGQGRPY